FASLISGNRLSGSIMTEDILSVVLALKVHLLPWCQTSTGNFTISFCPLAVVICTVKGIGIICNSSSVTSAPLEGLFSTYCTPSTAASNFQLLINHPRQNQSSVSPL